MTSTRTKSEQRGWGWYSPARRISIVALATASTVAIAAVSDRDSWIVAFDRAVLDAFRWDHSSPALEAVSLLGSTELALVVAGAIAIAVGPGRRRIAAWYAASVTAGIIANVLLKEIVARPRPVGSVTATSLDSFPSGHMIQATLLAILVPLVLRVTSRHTWPPLAATIVLWVGVATVAAARLLLAAHWPSDIITGVLIGALLGAAVVPPLRQANVGSVTLDA